jgi:hypothetical protein
MLASSFLPANYPYRCAPLAGELPTRCLFLSREELQPSPLMTRKYRESQQSSREVKPKFIDSTQGEPKDIYKP